MLGCSPTRLETITFQENWRWIYARECCRSKMWKTSVRRTRPIGECSLANGIQRLQENVHLSRNRIFSKWCGNERTNRRFVLDKFVHIRKEICNKQPDELVRERCASLEFRSIYKRPVKYPLNADASLAKCMYYSTRIYLPNVLY